MFQVSLWHTRHSFLWQKFSGIVPVLCDHIRSYPGGADLTVDGDPAAVADAEEVAVTID